jgi:hypothetical protein
MKPILVIGLGNELMGDDCIGCRLVEWLALDDALRDGMEFIEGGSDVLSLATRMEGRERVVLIDAVLSDDEPGTVSVDEEPFEDFEVRWEHRVQSRQHRGARDPVRGHPDGTVSGDRHPRSRSARRARRDCAQGVELRNRNAGGGPSPAFPFGARAAARTRQGSSRLTVKKSSTVQLRNCLSLVVSICEK